MRVDLPNERKALPLHLAARQCNKECVSELLKAAARMSAPMVTATMYSGITGQYNRPVEEIFRVPVNRQDENTALHEAARCGDTGIWQVLVEYGADPGKRNHDGASPDEKRAELEAVLQTTAKFNGSNAVGGLKCCCICYEGGDATGAGALVVTRCRHLFHERCLVQSFGGQETCPYCRQPLVN